MTPETEKRVEELIERAYKLRGELKELDKDLEELLKEDS